MSDHDINYGEVPADFPGMRDCDPGQRWQAWGICEELALYVCRECLRAKERAHKSVREVDILYQSFRHMQKHDWATDGELRWVYKRAASLLRWNPPDVVKENPISPGS